MREGWSMPNLMRRLNQPEGYDQSGIPEDYEEMLDRNPEIRANKEALVSLLPDQIHLLNGTVVHLEQTKALDLGAGTGIITEKIKDRVGQVIAVDRAQAMVDYLKVKFAGEDNIQVAQGDVLDHLPFQDNTVEVVVGAGIVSELPSKDETAKDKFLTEIMRVLKSGGVCLLDSIANQGRSGEDVILREEELEERLRNLGYECQVEAFFNENYKRYCAVRITLKGKNI